MERVAASATVCPCCSEDSSVPSVLMENEVHTQVSIAEGRQLQTLQLALLKFWL